MKKQLLVAAISAASALAFAPVMAADTVTLYGAARVGLASIDPGTQVAGVKAKGYTTAYSGANGMYGTSRWGIKGAEDLGGGVGAVFKFETALSGSYTANTNTDSQLDGDRYAYVGVSTGSAGTFLIGKDDRAIYKATSFSDYGTLLSSRLAFASGAINNGRVAGSILWNSPNWGGFETFVAYNPNTAYSYNAASPTETSLGFKYATGDLTVGLGYNNTVAQATTVAPDQAVTLSTDVVALAVAYKFALGTDMSVTPTLLYVNKAVGDYTLASGTNAYGHKQDVIALSVPFAMSATSNLLFVYGQAADLEKNDSTASGTDTGATNIGLEYNYALSKRTSLLAGYESVEYAKNNTAKMSTDAGGNKVKTTATTIAVGISHAF